MPDVIPMQMTAAFWRGKAQRAQRSGDLPEAIRLYRAALRVQESSGVRRELAQLYADAHCFSASERLYLENLAADAGDTDSLYGLARTRSMAGDRQEMADLLDLYLRVSPCGEQADHARDILWDMPRSPRPKKRMRRAETLLYQAERRKNDPEACQELLHRSWKRGHTPMAAQMLSRFSLQSNARAALRYAQDAAAMMPDDLETRLLLAAALRQMKMPHACISALRQAAKLCTEPVQLAIFFQRALAMDGVDIAIELLEKALLKAPSSTDCMLMLALALSTAGKDEERAAELLRRASEIDPDDPMVQTMLAATSEDQPDPAERFGQSLEKLRHMGPDTPDSWKVREEIFFLMQMPMQGITSLVTFLFLQTGDVKGLRSVLLRGNLPPQQTGMILGALASLGSPMPCLARVDGHMMLLPQQERPPYDADLHDLLRHLLRELKGSVPLDLVVRETPAAWHALPESVRRHCAQGRGTWDTVMSAYLLYRAGETDEAEKVREKSSCPRFVRRGLRRLNNRRENAR
ncbi:MAG: tetratricopeptide repeat protein [Clostridia bacterium]|nr:tetratricopeptide repeat protein [Clostridia bacterium]